MITTSVIDPVTPAKGWGETPVENTETVAPIVKFQDRKFTDVSWAVIYGLSYIAFLATGGFVWSQAHPRFSIDSNGIRTIHEYYEEDATNCCQGEDSIGSVCYLLNGGYDGGNRRLQAGTSKFNGDEGVFDAFLEAPEIIIGLLSITIVSAVVWVLLIRYFSKPVVIFTEVAKVGVLIALGILQNETVTMVLFFIGAIGLIAYDYWTRKQILFAADVMKYSTIAMKAKPSILIGSLFVKLLFVGNAVLFVTFFAKSFDVAEVVKSQSCYDTYNDDLVTENICSDVCEFEYPSYVFGISSYISASYLWTIIFLSQMRLSMIATIVGSWHFHPNNQPGVLVAMMNVGKSFGTLSVASLISAIAERINRLLSGKGAWKHFCNPFCCVTGPVNLCLCLIGSCFKTFIQMLTKFALILHVFTGKSFLGSAKSVFKIMSRHFKGGFVTETTSKSVLYLASYVFSILIALLAWKWVNDKFDCNSLPGDDGGSLWILYIFVILFNLWYPVLGLYIIIFANRFLQRMERERLNRNLSIQTDDSNQDTELNTNHIWIPPLVGAFVGCIAMMFFTFLADIFLDIINTIFLCFAIDKDNSVDTSNDEFESLVKQMPGYIQASDVENVTKHPVQVAYAVVE